LTSACRVTDKYAVTRGVKDIKGRVRLRRGAERRLAAGYLWIYSNDIEETTGTPEPGAIVDVQTYEGRFCGRGFINPHSKIRVRLLTSRDEPINDEYWAKRVASAVALRRRVAADTDAYRVVHGEGDLLPGLVVDRYGELLVMQTLAAGMEVRKELLAEVLGAQTNTTAVYLRNDVKSRALEGLSLTKGFLRGSGDTRREIAEGQVRFVVDVATGQKTGWFCDQRENRCAVASLARDAEVLDAFCHTGAFGIHGAVRGAASVLGFDESAAAVAMARGHAALNGVGNRCAYRETDAFEELRKLERKGRRFDLVILDPPGFAKSKQTVAHALAGYKEINLRALQLLRPDGVLATCSCSQHVSHEHLWGIVLAAARDARRHLRLLELRGQARDHPILAAMPETRYLKCLILQVL
jgi:23S rRNA (cytosine1962-C5)-methyltransferase